MRSGLVLKFSARFSWPDFCRSRGSKVRSKNLNKPMSQKINFSWSIKISISGLFRDLGITFKPLDLQRSGQENLAENFKTSSDLMYFFKIDWNLAKLFPTEGDAILLAKVVYRLLIIKNVSILELTFHNFNFKH